MSLKLDQRAEELKTCSLEILSNCGLIKSLKLSKKRNQNNTSVHVPPVHVVGVGAASRERFKVSSSVCDGAIVPRQVFGSVWRS